MKKMPKYTATDEHDEDEDMNDDQDSYGAEIDYDEDDESGFDDVPRMVGRANNRRIEARRAIERIREQMALKNALKDDFDFDYV